MSVDRAAVLVTGRPGCGKTTLIRRAVAELAVPAAGFYTDEIRSAGRREGFALVTLDGRRATLASVQTRSPHRVSRYGVDVRALESVGVSALEEATAGAKLLVVDEIGKMELFSPRFREAVLRALDAGGPVLASIMLSRHPFADALKERDDVRIIHLTPENRDRALGEVVAALQHMLR
jgi:nucleoside-triphosphatase